MISRGSTIEAELGGAPAGPGGVLRRWRYGTTSSHRYARYTFAGQSGYIIDSQTCGHRLVSLRHSAMVHPWADAGVHMHEASEEYYLLLHGELRLWVADAAVSLRAPELLMVRPGVAHAILGGKGPIEHFGIRAPAPEDRCRVAAATVMPATLVHENERELRRGWGYRIPLLEPRNRNCWLTGLGAARFRSPHLLLAYLDFPTHDEANAGLGTRHRLHLHKESWEYYAVLSGSKTLLVEEELVTIAAGEVLEVAPGVKHTLHGRQAPYRGFTLRVPILDDKVAF